MVPSLEQLEDRICPSNILNNLASTIIADTANILDLWRAIPQSSIIPSNAASPQGLTPQEVRSAYGFDKIQFTNSNDPTSLIPGDGNGQTIAIIDAYNDPNIQNDLAIFDATFGLPAPPNFSVVNQLGGTTLPQSDPTGGWEVEESLDVEWAHAVAPQANIVLVEANDSSFVNLFTAVQYVATIPNVSTASMSWIGPEFATELAIDSFFTTPQGHQGITWFAASGDYGSGANAGGYAPGYPSASPNVVSVGGTVLQLTLDGSRFGEIGWSGSGGGYSAYEQEPSYQSSVQSTNHRSTPDVSYNSALPYAVYDSFGEGSQVGWMQVYGTSAAAPQWAALVAIADQGRELAGLSTLDGANQTLPTLYAMARSNFNDITQGNNGEFSAGPGYDLVTGLGSPIAYLVVSSLTTNSYLPKSPPGSTPPTNPIDIWRDFLSIVVDQYDALAFRYLSLIDPRDANYFIPRYDSAQSSLASNPLLPTPLGQYADALGWLAFIQAVR